MGQANDSLIMFKQAQVVFDAGIIDTRIGPIYVGVHVLHINDPLSDKGHDGFHMMLRDIQAGLDSNGPLCRHQLTKLIDKVRTK